ncbi:MAG TPA: PRC-barrel domain-containing protein [Verrucomicrobiae bacterium]|nr:PRC-barrel domain-containing protein [Verrucomicrobiae bacterium]
MTHAKKAFVRGAAILGLAFVLSSLFPGQGRTQVAGSTTIGVSQEETKLVASGWSAKKNILGKAVYNDSNQKIGTVDDLIISPDRSVSFAIMGMGRRKDFRAVFCKVSDGLAEFIEITTAQSAPHPFH